VPLFSPRPTPRRDATRGGGSTVTVGLPHPEQMLTIPAFSLVAEERTLRGSYLGSSVPRRDVPQFIEAVRQVVVF
jgi:Zn-dependent alcohol dehydrogenase